MRPGLLLLFNTYHHPALAGFGRDGLHALFRSGLGDGRSVRFEESAHHQVAARDQRRGIGRHVGHENVAVDIGQNEVVAPPGNDYTPGAWFDIREGLYSVVRPAHPGVMTQECASLLDRMLSCDVRRLGDVGLNRDRRSEFLNAMLAYFGYHLDAISAVQSVRILKEVF